MKTLREVCTDTQVKRRALQGYEKAGLVSASGHNERGHLLYNEMAEQRIAKIRMYQEFGFSIKEIVSIIDAPDDVLKCALVEKLSDLESKSTSLEGTIYKLKGLIETL